MTDTKGMITVFGYGPTGEATVERLLARGQAVRVAQRKRPANLPAGVSFINCDALNADDVKRVIGKNGLTVSSIRSLLNVAASRHNLRVSLKVGAARDLDDNESAEDEAKREAAHAVSAEE